MPPSGLSLDTHLLFSDSQWQTPQRRTIWVSEDLCGPAAIGALWSHAAEVTLVNLSVIGTNANPTGTAQETGEEWRTRRRQ